MGGGVGPGFELTPEVLLMVKTTPAVSALRAHPVLLVVKAPQPGTVKHRAQHELAGKGPG